jgi:hypothetical protein
MAVLDRNTGADTMAGISSGASTPSIPTPRITSSRTRLNHGVFRLGDELATVYSSRRSTDCLGVTLSLGTGALVLTGSMTAAQARVMARALLAAAAAAESKGGL